MRGRWRLGARLSATDSAASFPVARKTRERTSSGRPRPSRLPRAERVVRAGLPSAPPPDAARRRHLKSSPDRFRGLNGRAVRPVGLVQALRVCPDPRFAGLELSDGAVAVEHGNDSGSGHQPDDVTWLGVPDDAPPSRVRTDHRGRSRRVLELVVFTVGDVCSIDVTSRNDTIVHALRDVSPGTVVYYTSVAVTVIVGTVIVFRFFVPIRNMKRGTI